MTIAETMVDSTREATAELEYTASLPSQNVSVASSNNQPLAEDTSGTLFLQAPVDFSW